MNEVYVAGEVNIPGKVVYSPSFTVAEYLAAAGGIDRETGSLDSLWFVDAAGNRTRVTTSSAVPPGTVIYVDRNRLDEDAEDVHQHHDRHRLRDGHRGVLTYVVGALDHLPRAVAREATRAFTNGSAIE